MLPHPGSLGRSDAYFACSAAHASHFADSKLLDVLESVVALGDVFASLPSFCASSNLLADSHTLRASSIASKNSRDSGQERSCGLAVPCKPMATVLHRAANRCSDPKVDKAHGGIKIKRMV